MDKLVIRLLTTMNELRDMQAVEAAVWRMPATPVHQTYTALNNGGIILGAFDGKKMIGFLYSFAGFDGKVPYVCSHMLGILPAYRTAGLGVQMKLKQAQIARAMGYHMITWTFDPLESRNAYLNLHKLHASGARYKENHYGAMKDELNQGLPSDRILIKWDLNTEQTFTMEPFDDSKLLLDVNSEGWPVATECFHAFPSQMTGILFVAIPDNFQEIKQRNFQLAKQWRLETRKVFQMLFTEGYRAKDLIRVHSSPLNYYVFAK
jgi:predicted GNAT superfamily acetyltransferase